MKLWISCSVLFTVTTAGSKHTEPFLHHLHSYTFSPVSHLCAAYPPCTPLHLIQKNPCFCPEATWGSPLNRLIYPRNVFFFFWMRGSQDKLLTQQQIWVPQVLLLRSYRHSIGPLYGEFNKDDMKWLILWTEATGPSSFLPIFSQETNC